MGLLWSEVLCYFHFLFLVTAVVRGFVLFSFSIFSDCRSLKIENEKNSIIILQKFDHRSLIYEIIGTQD